MKPRLNEYSLALSYLNNSLSMSYLNLFMPKTAFPIFHVYKDLGCGQGLGRGHRDLGPRINEMLYSHLYLNNELSMSYLNSFMPKTTFFNIS